MKSLTRTHEFTVEAPPEKVFPLLCPVREYEWIPTWRCEMLHSQSGVAEEDCVFRTNFPDSGPMTWVVSRYEPPVLIEFTCFTVQGIVMRLKIRLQSMDGVTQLHWTRRWLATTPAAEAWIAGYTAETFTSMMAMLQSSLTHYLATGTMLRP